ncbi:acyltransferase [Sulfurovum sp. TSL1]|uniref:acyltransferase family protein n=1 Tax=Sulfurovum sp. TSL1 TaxID=2826994 RepID=UPI001CC55244|nr:acyltransferase [Sulfurovum sp. TSL1]GIT98135.1 acyltransferase [Sulfurovum sp. TSL1]
MTHQPYMYSLVDLWRSVAVLLVVVAHTLLWWGNPVFLGVFEPSLLGSTGVAIFFVLTSYVLMMSLERLREKSEHLYTDFMLRRFFRIYPLSLIVVLFYYLTQVPSYFENGIYFRYPEISFSGFIQNLLLIQNFTIPPDILGPLWSLPYEFQMYFFLPILFYYIKDTDTKWKMIFLFFILLLLFFVLKTKVDSVNKLLLYIQIPDYAKWGLCFIPGVGAYYAQKEYEGKIIPSQYILVVIVIILFARMINYHFFIQVFSAILIGFTLVLMNDNYGHWLKKLTEIISKYSYGIYLTHMLAIYLGFELFGATFLGWTVFLASLLVLPVLCYHLIEKPCIDWSKKYCSLKFSKKEYTV